MIQLNQYMSVLFYKYDHSIPAETAAHTNPAMRAFWTDSTNEFESNISSDGDFEILGWMFSSYVNIFVSAFTIPFYTILDLGPNVYIYYVCIYYYYIHNIYRAI